MSPDEPGAGWRRVPLPGLAAAVDLLDGVPVSEGVFEETSYVVQVAPPVVAGVWYGPGQDLEGFRASFGPAEPVTFDRESRARVAGTPARRQTGRVTAGTVATGLVAGPGGELGHVDVVSGDVTHVAVAWVREGTPVLMRWQVETAERERWRAAEEHFFGSVTFTRP
jgi:hypothetical protein